MELRHIRYFVMAAEEGSISSAAARLNISQPAVSRQIKDLEDELGTPLFLRTSTGLALTESGELALEQAKLLLAQAGNLIKSVSKAGKKATLKIGYISTALPGF
ncbi:MAG: LysR family transcriptional regulator, partial [Methylococcales bacterium]|nr:LysR family transcriptional regulator [Methylococcales bacterium]